MSGNASFRLGNTSCCRSARSRHRSSCRRAPSTTGWPPTYERVGLLPGMLVKLAGVRERRWWPEDVSFADGAAMAGAKALAEAGIRARAGRRDDQHLGLP